MISQERIESLWFTDRSNAELCELLGTTNWGLSAAKARYGLPRRLGVRGGTLADPDTGRRRDDPDEATIEAMCLKIQAGWSEEEERRRRVGSGGR